MYRFPDFCVEYVQLSFSVPFTDQELCEFFSIFYVLSSLGPLCYVPYPEKEIDLSETADVHLHPADTPTLEMQARSNCTLIDHHPSRLNSCLVHEKTIPTSVMLSLPNAL